MQFEPIKVTPFAGTIAPVVLPAVEAAPSDAEIVAHGNRTTVHNVLCVGIGLLMQLRKQSKQGKPQCFWHGMKSAVEAALGEHFRNVAMLFEKETTALLIAVKEGGGNEGDGHDFGGRHLGLRVVVIAVGG